MGFWVWQVVGVSAELPSGEAVSTAGCGGPQLQNCLRAGTAGPGGICCVLAAQPPAGTGVGTGVKRVLTKPGASDAGSQGLSLCSVSPAPSTGRAYHAGSWQKKQRAQIHSPRAAKKGELGAEKHRIISPWHRSRARQLSQPGRPAQIHASGHFGDCSPALSTPWWRPVSPGSPVPEQNPCRGKGTMHIWGELLFGEGTGPLI